jgi:hypothetical protein
MKKLMLISLAVLISASGAFAGWWQTFGGPQRDEGTCVQQTSDGGYIVTGFTWSFGDIGNANMWLIKLDSLGNKEWDKTYGLGWGYSVRQTADGGYIIVGSSLMRMDANGDIIWTRPYAGRCVQQTSDGGYIITGNVWDLMKVSKDGDSLWARDYKKGNASSGFYCIEQTSDGGYILTYTRLVCGY